MLNRVPERYMHIVRWILAIGWLVLIASLFYDPITPLLTLPENVSSPFHIDTSKCIVIQNSECIGREPYSLSARLFWAAIVPAGIFIIFIFGHEAWRRICPLSFFSQIPRRLGRESKGKTIEEDSWLGKNHLYLQFSFLFLGLCARLLLVNSDRAILGCFLILTILLSILVGYIYEGKSWCNYFCPFSPVQGVFTGPRGLLGSSAQGQQQLITQSMCRTINKSTGKEESACVACKYPCIDVDAEKTYWEELNKPGKRFVQYGYVGILIGFYLYFYLFCGNWDYYFSGAWTHNDTAAKMFVPGFFFLPQIPKILAVPLSLGICVGLSYFILCRIEKFVRGYFVKHDQPKKLQEIETKHIVFTFCTVFAWYYFFSFGGRPNVNALAHHTGETTETIILNTWNIFIAIVGAVWLYRTLPRKKEDFEKESSANSLRRQLKLLLPDEILKKVLPNQALEDLSPNEVYLLTKTLPEVTQRDRHKFYQELMKEQLIKNNQTINSLFTSLENLRKEMGITDKEHDELLKELEKNGHKFYTEVLQETIKSTNPTGRNSNTITNTSLIRLRKDLGISDEQHNEITRTVLKNDDTRTVLKKNIDKK